MAARLSIHLLGPFHVTLDGEPVTGFESNKARALLAYLAAEADRPHSREALAGLLWPEQPDRIARRNLSQALFNLRQVIHDDDARPPFLRVTRRTVQFDSDSDYWLDAAAFASHIAAGKARGRPRPETGIRRLEQAIVLYRGDFLTGFFVDDSVLFEEWVTLRRERFHRQVLDALYHLAKHYERRRDYDRARHYARRQVELEPWREEAHQQLMRVLARSGQRSAALAQYTTCCRALAEELGVEPHQETIALYERIRAAGSARPHNLPDQPTPFVGRQEQLSQITERLEDPACRLLTLVGPGGIGKTRLALQAAAEALDVFLHGVYFVSLSPVGSAEFLIPTVANALGLQFHGRQEPLEQLLSYLREKELLLVMDSFEHLLQGADLLTGILKGAPCVKILAASRERLDLRAEWLLDVPGLAYPRDGQTDGLESYSAVQLFLQNAGRVRADFALSKENRPHVARICQLAEGMPLGIELASAWVRTLSCEQIAGEIQHNLDFLTTSLRDVPERHRSMRAVFEHSWKLLSETEKGVFSRLSVFLGGCRPEAAGRVAGASLPVLAALVDQSLLRQAPSGRYEIHELLRQYAAEKLCETQGAEEKTRDQHSAYYADFLHQRAEGMRGTGQKEALEEIDIEIDNVRAGWRRAAERGEQEIIGKCLSNLYYFYNVRGWFQEGEEAFGRAAAKLGAGSASDEGAPVGEQGLILGQVLARQGSFSFHLGQYEKARGLYQTSLSISRSRDDCKNVAFSLVNLGFVSHVQGEYAEARRLSQEGLAIFRDAGDQPGVAFCLNNLGHIARALGEYDKARQLHQECRAIRRQIGDAHGIAVAIHSLGNIAEALGEYAEARKLYQECLLICREIGYQLGTAASLANLGHVARQLGEYAKARQLNRESLDIKRELGDRRSIIYSLINLGEVDCALGEYRESRKRFGQALRMALDIQAVPLAVEVLVGMAILLSTIGEKTGALELCAFVLRHPAAKKQHQERVEGLLSELVSPLPPEVAAAARARAGGWTLDDVAAEVLAEV